MTDNEKELEDEAQMEKLCDSLDWDGFLSLLRAEYQRGRDDYRDDLLAQLDMPRTKTTDGMVPRPSDKAETVQSTAKPVVITDHDHKPLVVRSCAEIKPEPAPEPILPPRTDAPGGDLDDSGPKGTPDQEKRTSELPRPSKPGRGPKITDINRPEAVPSNWEMVRFVLKDASRPLFATEIRDTAAKRWWPDMPKDWKSTVYGFLGSKKVVKTADGRFVLPQEVPNEPPKVPNQAEPVSAVPVPRPSPQEIIDREAAKRGRLPVRDIVPAMVVPMPPAQLTGEPRPQYLRTPSREPIGPPPSPREVVTPGAKLGPPARQNGVEFKHGDKTVVLHQREASIAVQLRLAIGKGHLDAKLLATSIGIKSDQEAMIRDLVAIMNPKIAPLGLEILYYAGWGYILKESVSG